jgi:hypothetical protein
VTLQIKFRRGAGMIRIRPSAGPRETVIGAANRMAVVIGKRDEQAG